MNLQELRKEIDSIDNQIVSLFARRMEISSAVAVISLTISARDVGLLH